MPSPRTKKGSGLTAHIKPIDEPTAGTLAKKGTGKVIQVPVRLTPTQWEKASHLAISERTTMQDLIIRGLSMLLEKRGLDPL